MLGKIPKIKENQKTILLLASCLWVLDAERCVEWGESEGETSLMAFYNEGSNNEEANKRIELPYLEVDLVAQE